MLYRDYNLTGFNHPKKATLLRLAYVPVRSKVSCSESRASCGLQREIAFGLGFGLGLWVQGLELRALGSE